MLRNQNLPRARAEGNHLCSSQQHISACGAWLKPSGGCLWSPSPGPAAHVSAAGMSPGWARPLKKDCTCSWWPTTSHVVAAARGRMQQQHQPLHGYLVKPCVIVSGDAPLFGTGLDLYAAGCDRNHVNHVGTVYERWGFNGCCGCVCLFPCIKYFFFLKTAFFLFFGHSYPDLCSNVNLYLLRWRVSLTRPDWTEPLPTPPRVAQNVSECLSREHKPGSVQRICSAGPVMPLSTCKNPVPARPRRGCLHRREARFGEFWRFSTQFCREKRTYQDHLRHRILFLCNTHMWSGPMSSG